MSSNLNHIREGVGKYYSNKINEHGISPKGVDWNSEESQALRFDQLIKVIDSSRKFTLLDYGCGYGALVAYLRELGKNYSYLGYDISEEMLIKASQANANDQNVRWTGEIDQGLKSDYVLASGVFNVKLDNGTAQWEEYILDTIAQINSMAQVGFAFNILTSYSDPEYQRDDLYYADPNWLFDYCKKKCSKFVALLHDYPLYEFTILVKKQDHE